jgi:hypothetical protein
MELMRPEIRLRVDCDGLFPQIGSGEANCGVSTGSLCLALAGWGDSPQPWKCDANMTNTPKSVAYERLMESCKSREKLVGRYTDRHGRDFRCEHSRFMVFQRSKAAQLQCTICSSIITLLQHISISTAAQAQCHRPTPSQPSGSP